MLNLSKADQIAHDPFFYHKVEWIDMDNDGDLDMDLNFKFQLLSLK